MAKTRYEIEIESNIERRYVAGKCITLMVMRRHSMDMEFIISCFDTIVLLISGFQQIICKFAFNLSAIAFYRTTAWFDSSIYVFCLVISNAMTLCSSHIVACFSAKIVAEDEVYRFSYVFFSLDMGICDLLE